MDNVALRCPKCGTTGFTANPDGTLTCTGCRASFVTRNRTCPSCGKPIRAGEEQCAACGARLAVQCARCGASNLDSAPRCHACGHALDMAAQIGARASAGSAETDAGRRAEVASIKAQEEASSRARVQDWWQDEYQRREQVAQALRRREEDQRRWGLVLIGGGLILLAVLVLALVAAGPSLPTMLGLPLSTGVPAPPFALQDTAGETVSLSDFTGQPVVLNFWSPT